MNTALPRCTLVTGAIGSGKTHVAAGLVRSLRVPYISPDLYLQELLGCACCSLDSRYDRARELCKWRLRTLAEEGRSFLWETVVASQWKWDFLTRLRTTHRLAVVYVAVRSPEICLRRAEERARAGWYKVPPGKVVDSYRAMDFSRSRLAGLSSEFIRIDNSVDLVGSDGEIREA